MDAELEFAIQPNTTGKQLFDQVSLCQLFDMKLFVEYLISNFKVFVLWISINIVTLSNT